MADPLNIPPNRLQRQLERLQEVPSFLRPWVRNLIMRRAVPFTGTAGIRYAEMTPQRVEVALANEPRVQNHIQGIHASAMNLLAETATGFCVGINLPDDKLPLIKSLKVDYYKRTKGDMRAVATLDAADIARIHSEPKGEILVPVTVTDESGNEPIQCEMVWAWVPKKG